MQPHTQSPQFEASTSRAVHIPSDPALPRPCLTSDAIVSRWQNSPGFQYFWAWIKRRCDRLKGKEIIRGPFDNSAHGIRSLMNMLDQMTSWIEDAPPQPQSNQRFGNLAFRTYNKLLQEVSCFSHRISANIDGRDYLRSLIHGISLPTFVLNCFLY